MKYTVDILRYVSQIKTFEVEAETEASAIRIARMRAEEDAVWAGIEDHVDICTGIVSKEE